MTREETTLQILKEWAEAPTELNPSTNIDGYVTKAFMAGVDTAKEQVLKIIKEFWK